jgi:hypothetical protein
MAVKGYVSVPKDRAAAKEQQLATIAAQNADLKTMGVLPPPTPNKTTVIKKRKIKSARDNPKVFAKLIAVS